MPVPDYQKMMLPILTILKDGQERHMSEIREEIADHFQLTEEERRQLLPGGSQLAYHNRSNWATTYLFKAGLLERPKRGVYRINSDGRKYLESDKDHITVQDLNEIPQFATWYTRSINRSQPRSKSVAEPKLDQSSDETPEETIQRLTQELKDQLATDLLEQLHNMDPYKFEQLIVDLMLAMGYGGSRVEAGKVTQASNDGGIDGVINEDRLGLDTIYLQAKRWQNPVGRKEIQSFVGALAGRQAHKGVFITTSSFNKNAYAYANTVSQKVILIDGQRLAQLMIDFDLGVSTAQTLKLKKIDTDYFES